MRFSSLSIFASCSNRNLTEGEPSLSPKREIIFLVVVVISLTILEMLAALNLLALTVVKTRSNRSSKPFHSVSNRLLASLSSMVDTIALSSLSIERSVILLTVDILNFESPVLVTLL